MIGDIDSTLSLQEICEQLNKLDLDFKFAVEKENGPFGPYYAVYRWLPEEFPEGDRSDGISLHMETLDISVPYFIKLALDKDEEKYPSRCWRKFEDDVEWGISSNGESLS